MPESGTIEEKALWCYTRSMCCLHDGGGGIGPVKNLMDKLKECDLFIVSDNLCEVDVVTYTISEGYTGQIRASLRFKCETQIKVARYTYDKYKIIIDIEK